MVQDNFAVEMIKAGTSSLACSVDGFNGVDPAPDAEKACFCDEKRKYFDD